jgi:hypothetical protein
MYCEVDSHHIITATTHAVVCLLLAAGWRDESRALTACLSGDSARYSRMVDTQTVHNALWLKPTAVHADNDLPQLNS